MYLKCHLRQTKQAPSRSMYLHWIYLRYKIDGVIDIVNCMVDKIRFECSFDRYSIVRVKIVE